MRSESLNLRRLSWLLSLSLMPWTGVAAQTSSAASTQSVILPRLTQPIDESVLTPIKGTVHPAAKAASDRGAVDDGMTLERVQVVLKRSAAQEQDLQRTLRALHTPGSADYHQWLTPEEFGKRFGVSDQDVATVTSWLATHGMTVTKVNPGKGTLEFSASAGSFRQTFHTAIHQFNVNGQTHYANTSDPQIPAALAPVFGGFSSLNDFRVKKQLKLLGQAQYDPATHKTTPQWTTGQAGYVPNLIVAPGDFAVQYDLNPLYTANVKGAGQTIAIINDANISLTLANQYRTLFGLPANPPNVIIDGNDPGIDGQNNPDGPNGDSIEAYLDVEQSGAVAPAATIDLVIGGDTALDSGLYLAAEHAVYGNIAPILSVSFGGCEADQSAAGNAFISSLWEQAAAQGQTVLVSTGDSGSAGCDGSNGAYATEGQAVNGLGSTPYNVAVGGTDFFYSDYATGGTDSYAGLATYWNETPSNATPTTSLLQKVPEQPWNDSQFGLNYVTGLEYEQTYGATTVAAGSGGASNCATGTAASGSGSGGTCAGYPKPTWQTGAGVPADKVRDLPDVSLFAADGSVNFSAYPICYEDGDCQPVSADGTIQITEVGGTSGAAPSFAGIMALVNQKYGRQGQADFVLYPLATQFPSAFNDVTVGSNSVPCAYAAPAVTATVPASVDCIAAANPLIYQDATYGPITEGQIGTGTTPEYNAATGYDLATGLGSIDANNLVTNWGNVKFAASTVTLAASSTSFVHGTAVTLSGAVTPGTASGVVGLTTTSGSPLNVFENSSTLIGTPDLTVTNGSYSGSVAYLPGGTYTVAGDYSGDGVNAPSTSNAVSFTVTPEPSTLQLAPLNSGYGSSGSTAFANGATIAYGTQVQLLGEPLPTGYYNRCVTANGVTCNTAEYGVPTGTVMFSDSGSGISTAPVNSDGNAFYNAPFAIGTHSITASYSGDASYGASTAAAFTFTVGKDLPAINLTSATEQTTAAGSTETGTTAFTVQVENIANYNATEYPYGVGAQSPAAAPTGVVTITGLPTGTLTLPALQTARDPNVLGVEGAASLAVPSGIAAGTYNLTVSYPGDANYAATSTVVPFTISGAAGIATTTTASASPTATSVTTPITISLSIAGTTAGGVPTGSVAVVESGSVLGSLTLPTGGTGSSFSGSFQLNSQSLIQGTNVITVQYSGSSVYAPSSALVTVTNGGSTASPSIALSNSGTIAIATQGGSGTSTITVTPSGGFTGAVGLTCAVTPTTRTDTPTCSIGGVTVASTAAVTAVMTVGTTAAALEVPQLRTVLGGGVAMATLLFLVLPKRRRRLSTLLGAVVLMAAIGFSAGCGSGNPGGGTTGTTGGTTTGTYTVTVTATGSGVTSATTAVQVTVQ